MPGCLDRSNLAGSHAGVAAFYRGRDCKRVDLRHGGIRAGPDVQDVRDIQLRPRGAGHGGGVCVLRHALRQPHQLGYRPGGVSADGGAAHGSRDGADQPSPVSPGRGLEDRRHRWFDSRGAGPGHNQIRGRHDRRPAVSAARYRALSTWRGEHFLRAVDRNARRPGCGGWFLRLVPMEPIGCRHAGGG